MPTAAAKTGLSLLIMLMGWFQDGLAKLDQKDYPGAIAAFTKVIHHEETDADLRQSARTHRAAAYSKAGELDKAKRDLAQVLKETGSAEARARVFARIAGAGIDATIFLPKETPEQAFARTQKLGADRDLAGFRKRLAGDFVASLRMMEHLIAAEGRGDAAREISQMCGDLQYASSQIGKGADLGTAQAVAAVNRGRLQLTFRLVAVGDEWHFDTLLDAKRGDKREGREMAAPPVAVGPKDVQEVQAVLAEVAVKEVAVKKVAVRKVAVRKVAARKAVAAPADAAVVAAAPSVVVAAEVGDLEILIEGKKLSAKDVVARELPLQKKITDALYAFAGKHGGDLPKELDEVADLLGKEAHILEFADPNTGKSSPRLYHCLGNLTQVSKPKEMFLVATPVAIDGKRVVAFADGHGGEVPEDEFLKVAKAQKWDLTPKKPKMTKAELKAKVDALVTQLGDAKAAQRKAAYWELKRMGEKAEPILEAHRGHPDPEIRLSVRKLLKEDLPKRATVPVRGMQGGLMQLRR